MIRKISGYWSTATRHPAVTPAILVLAMVSTLLEGAAVVALIPMLELAIGTDGNAAAATALAERVSGWLSMEFSISFVLIIFPALGITSALMKYGLSVLQAPLGESRRERVPAANV